MTGMTIEKAEVMIRVKELAKNQTWDPNQIGLNQAEIAVLMETFGIRWNEIDLPLEVFKYQELTWQSETLRADFNKLLAMLERSLRKELVNLVGDIRLSIKGFWKGVDRFDAALAKELAIAYHQVNNGKI